MRNSIDPLDHNQLMHEAKMMQDILSENGRARVLSDVADSFKNHSDEDEQDVMAAEVVAKLLQF